MALLNQVAQAARNNAFWCEAVCRAHGVPGAFYESIWLNRSVTPPFYPNAVTLTGAEDSAAQLSHIQDLIKARIPGGWAVKDSFAALDLDPLRFHMLFDASWLWRSASALNPGASIEGIQWTVIRERSELARWEVAWSEKGALIPDALRTFPPALLADPEIAFIAGYHEQRMIAGGIANRSEGVVGLSNVFTPSDHAAGYWGGLLAMTMDCFPGLSLVGYERGDALAIALSLGFEITWPLRIWARPPLEV